MDNNFFQYLETNIALFPLLGIGLAFIFQGINLWSKKEKLYVLSYLYWGAIVLLAVVVSLILGTTWVGKVTPTIQIWSICLIFIFNGGKWLEEFDNKYKWVGGVIMAVGVIIFVVGCNSYVNKSDNPCCAGLTLVVTFITIIAVFVIIEWAKRKGKITALLERIKTNINVNKNQHANRNQ